MNRVNYEHGILQVMSTIRTYVGISSYFDEDQDIKTWFDQHQFQQVIVLLIDGMGAYQIDNYATQDGFFKKHMLKSVDTVYPPTTVAATTAVQTGKAPCTTGWLAWQQYMRDINQHVIMFFNSDYYSETLLNSTYSYDTFPIKNMVEECSEKGIHAKEIFPSWREQGAKDFQDMCNKLVEESKTQEMKYIYAYWDEYDSYMHDHGASDAGSISMLQDYDKILERTMKNLDANTGLMIIADHGHIDIKSKYLIEYPDILECLQVLPAFETRTLNFFVKEEYKEVFVDRFTKHFKDEFILLRKQEVLDSNLFGFGDKHERFEEQIGDYIACAIKDVQLAYDKHYDLKGHHAGMTKEEIEIPVILYNKM